MNDNLLCFYDSGGGGDSDTNESEERIIFLWLQNQKQIVWLDLMLKVFGTNIVSV